MSQKPNSSRGSSETPKNNGLEIYNTIAENVGGIPSLRKRDNLFQAVFIAGGTLIGGAIGWGMGMFPGLLIGVLSALVLSTLISGVVLMITGWVRLATKISRRD